MQRNAKIAIAGVALAGAAVTAGVGVAGAGSGPDDDAGDTPIESPELEKASAAALEHAGPGTVTGTEIEDEESYYEVEIKLDSGGVVDVQLDRSFTVVGQAGDSDTDEGEAEG